MGKQEMGSLFVWAILALACSSTPGRTVGTRDAAVDASRDTSLDVQRLDARPQDAIVPVNDAGEIPRYDVKVVMTADNAYGFGWGPTESIERYFGRPAVDTSSNHIFACPIGYGPEAYEIPAADADPNSYVYVVAWNDRILSQGVIGQFYREGSEPLYTGDSRWEVCATGVEYKTSVPAQANGPELEVINRELARCNAGSGDPVATSAGWVNAERAVTPNATGLLAIGEDNSTEYGSTGWPEVGNEFRIACQRDSEGNQGIDPQARWMWYRAPGETGSGFEWNFFLSDQHPGGNYAKQFLIFRLKVEAIIL